MDSYVVHECVLMCIITLSLHFYQEEMKRHLVKYASTQQPQSCILAAMIQIDQLCSAQLKTTVSCVGHYLDNWNGYTQCVHRE